jgi:hypothetical protein
MNIIRDIEFQKILLSFICRDRNFLRDTGYLLSADDFKPVSKDDGYENHTIAKLAFEHWNKTREPIGPLLRTFIIDYADEKKMGEKQTEKLLKIVKEVSDTKRDIISVDSVAEKVIKFKKNRLKKIAVERAAELLEKGELSDEQWYKICMNGVESFSENKHESTDYLTNTEDRIKRREAQKRFVRYPLLLIDPWDESIRAITRKQYGIALAPSGNGKSLLLIWIAFAYILQGLNVIYITLEDNREITEDRFDALLTGIATKELGDQNRKFRRKFRKIKLLIHSRLKIIDGTEGGVSVARIEEIWERERNKGFIADAILTDYDEEIEPAVKYGKDAAGRRMELSDIHKDYRRLMARRNLLGWIAAQTNRKGEGKKYITKELIGEDYGKIKKSFCCIGVGKGDWGDDSKFIYVTKNKNDKSEIGWNIFSDFEHGTFFDRDRTLKQYRREAKKAKKEKD